MRILTASAVAVLLAACAQSAPEASDAADGGARPEGGVGELPSAISEGGTVDAPIAPVDAAHTPPADTSDSQIVDTAASRIDAIPIDAFDAAPEVAHDTGPFETTCVRPQTRQGAVELPASGPGFFAHMEVARRMPQRLFVISIGPDGRLFRSDDGGRTYCLLPLAAEPVLSALAPSDPDIVYCVVRRAGVIELARSTDGGRTWTIMGGLPQGIPASILVDPTRPDWLITAGLSSDPFDRRPFGASPSLGVWRTTDGGRTWRGVGPYPEFRSFRLAFAPEEAGRVYVTGVRSEGRTSSDELLTSTDHGATWSRATWPAKALEGYLTVGAGGSVYLLGSDLDAWNRPVTQSWASTDAGQTWERRALPDDSSITASGVWMADPFRPNVIFALGYRLHLSFDGARTWTVSSEDSEERPWALADVRLGDGVVYAYMKTGLWASQDDGRTWTERQLQMGQDTIVGAGGDHVYAGDGLWLYHSADRGDTFRRVPWRLMCPCPPERMPKVHAVWVDPSDPKLAIVSWSGVGEGLFRTTDAGANWTVQERMNTFDVVVFAPSNRDRVYGARWGVWRSDDRGATWSPLENNPTSDLLRVMAVAPSDADTVVVASSPGNAWVTRDAGRTWRMLACVSNVMKLVIDPRDARLVYVLTASQNWVLVKVTDDGACTRVDALPNVSTANSGVDMVFETVPPHALVVAFSSQNLGVPAGGIHTTTDGGQTWKKISATNVPTLIISWTPPRTLFVPGFPYEAGGGPMYHPHSTRVWRRQPLLD